MRYIVAGAPVSGKSTFVKESANAGDLIYDYDTLHQALSGQGAHNHLKEIRPYVLTARDAIFDDLEAHANQNAWVITSTRKLGELNLLSERFGAEIILMEVSQDEAHKRADFDGRPAEWHDYIDNWFDDNDIIGNLKSKRYDMKKKTFQAPIELKSDSDETGQFTAVFSTLNVIDHDGDVTQPGAFDEGQKAFIESWNHGWNLPVGKGVIHADDDNAWVDGEFFLETASGLEHYKAVKAAGDLVEWSYTFQILKSSQGEVEGQPVRYLEKLDTVGVSPVTRGAGIDTRTVSVKNADEDEDEAGDGKSSVDTLAKIDLIELTVITTGAEA